METISIQLTSAHIDFPAFKQLHTDQLMQTRLQTLLEPGVVDDVDVATSRVGSPNLWAHEEVQLPVDQYGVLYPR